MMWNVNSVLTGVVENGDMEPDGDILMTEVAVVTVHYRVVDGWHVFTSDDVYGLYVASKNPIEAVEDVIPSVKLLIKMNEGVECEIKTTKSFREVMALAQTAQDVGEEISRPEVIESQQLVIWPKAA